MRSHNGEHSDSLPVLDIASLRHVAYVLDALVYYMRSGTDIDSADAIRDTASVQSWVDNDDAANDDADDDPVSQSVAMETDSVDDESDAGKGVGRKHTFFQRTDSTTFLGCVAPDPFHVPMVDAIPLAERPQLLLPNARKEELFGVPKHTLADVASSSDKSPFLPTPTPFDRMPVHLALSTRVAGLTRGYNAGTTAATEAPQCSVSQAPPHTDSHAVAQTNATVIVRPSAQVATTATDGSRGTATNSDSGATTTALAPSGGNATEHATKPVAGPSTVTTPSSTEAPVATEPGTHEVEKPCTQASVIVHASAAQSMTLHPTGASQKPTASAPEGVKAEGSVEESREQGPSAAPASTTTVR